MRIQSKMAFATGAVLSILLSGRVIAQASGEVKVPHPLPATRPVKGPAPATPPKAPATNVSRQVAPRPAVTDHPKASLPENASLVRPKHDPNAIYFAEPGDGAIWVRGAAYKASFSAKGAQYIPFLGSSAPQNYPVWFSLQSVELGGKPVAFATDVAATRTDRTIAFDRGGVIETYQMAPEGMEQMFVFDSLPTGGDLVVRLRVDTELGGSETEDGFRFSNELGYVSYGRAHAYDAHGSATLATTILDGDSIEIRVPASFLSTAAFPVTIDPVVENITVSTSVLDDFSPDVAYLGLTGWLIVYEETFSATDHDVYSVVYPAIGAGFVADAAYIDFTTDYWAHPRVASNAVTHNFMVVAAVGIPSNASRIIRGATRHLSGPVVGPFNVSAGATESDNYNPDIGGDPTLVPPTYFLVSWESTYLPSDHDIFARLVDPSGNLQGPTPIFVDYTTDDDRGPSISRCDGQTPFSTQRWTITWYRDHNHSGTDHDIYGAQYLWDGSIVHATFPIDVSTNDDFDPQASSVLDGNGERDYLVVYRRVVSANNNDIHSRIYNGTTLVSDADLSALQDQGFSSENQINPSVDSDGNCYAVAYSEQYATSATDYDMYVTSVAKNGTVIQVAERHVNFDFSTYHSDHPRIASAYSGGAHFTEPVFVLVWDTDSLNTSHDILGGVFDAGTFATFCSPSGSFFDQVIACPCSNPPAGYGQGCNNSSNTGGAILYSSGMASLSGDTVTLTATGEKPTGASNLLQGNLPAFGGIAFGQGVRCVGGVLKRLYTHTASHGVVSAPLAGEPSVSARSAALGDPISAGSARYYLWYYRDPIVLGGCPASLSFNATPTGSRIWAP